MGESNPPYFMIAHNAAKLFYGESLVDLPHEESLIILYPEILITDPQNNTHLIKDLLIKLHIRENKILGMYCDRLTFSDLEWAFAGQNYIHSHVTGEAWGTFCLGNSDVSRLISDSTMGEFTEDHWCLFFVTLENFLQTESEGPYKYIRSLNLENVDKDNSRFDASESWYSFKQLFPTYKVSISLNATKDRLFTVELDNDFFRDFALILPDHLKGIYDPRTDNARQINVNQKLFHGKTGSFIDFKGERRYKTVYTTVIEDKDLIRPDYPLRGVCQDILQYLEEELYARKIQNYRKIPSHSLNDLQKHLRGNLESA